MLQIQISKKKVVQEHIDNDVPMEKENVETVGIEISTRPKESYLRTNSLQK